MLKNLTSPSLQKLDIDLETFGWLVGHLDDVDAVAAPQASDSSFSEHVGEGVVHAQRFPAAVNLQIPPKLL